MSTIQELVEKWRSTGRSISECVDRVYDPSATIFGCASELEAALSKSPWIPVGERVPTHNNDVFLLIDNEQGATGCWHGRYWLIEGHEISPHRVTHWMEVPEL